MFGEITTTIEEFNQFLIDKHIELDINDYFLTINNMFYDDWRKEKVTDAFIIDFINKFVKETTHDEKIYSITEDDLVERNIIITKKRMSKNIKKLIKKCNLIENKDYKVKDDTIYTGKKGAKKEYTFTFSACHKLEQCAGNCYNAYKRKYYPCDDILKYYNYYIANI